MNNFKKNKGIKNIIENKPEKIKTKKIKDKINSK
jgi:hypothetical protein